MLETLTAWLGAHSLLSILGAPGIGVITAMAPCSIVTLPLLVASAVALSEDIDTPAARRRFVIRFSLLFVLGLVISFSILMLLTAKIGIMLSVAPLWADLLAALASFAVAAYAMGWLGQGIDKQKIAAKLLRFKLLGALVIGLIFGLVSTPCASAPLVAIITVAESAGWVHAYILVLSFALGHASLLLAAGISVGFAQKIASNRRLGQISRGINALFIATLVLIGTYFLYKAWQLF
ncbi:cytochrome c biogenesis CcdA family protein [Nitratifractor salsuginis]|uniref:Cytochrome c biogenesis protein transmembrane region n=1 Tax=Nitratifractor salsuginis (strain DSM 16511 / JCM 12458 / E9I37-1) TaxID=749222 RepID=E6X114_NITSE|nr:cytochrome c biogenesis protein CcdA [Nitratifractor salsuginis]ADV45817.1 cytochrome c biogenesis protein transmembrane region [Nitratifractor salsuginis DSM 16511]